MIEVSFTTALMIYLCLTLGILLSLWSIQHYMARKKKINLSEKEVFVCEFCHYCYLDEHPKKITRCPQCHSLNSNPHAK